jgi:dienelactone hydrolase
MVRVWYPTRADGPGRLYAIGPEREVLEAFARATGGVVPADWLDMLAGVRTHSVTAAPAASGSFPMLVFSHGGFSYVWQNTPLMEHLASHGYVVWSVSHPGGSGGVCYPDGTVVTYDESLLQEVLAFGAEPSYPARFTGDVDTRLRLVRAHAEGPLARIQRQWAEDMRAVLEAVTAGRVEGAAAELVDHCDVTRVGALGMSLGGAAAVSAAHADPRIRVAVNLDGGHFSSDLLDTDSAVPLLHLSSDFEAQLKAFGSPAGAADANEMFYERWYAAGGRPGIHRLRVRGMTHLEMSDVALVPTEQRARILHGGGRIDSRRAIELLNAFVLGCIDQVLGDGDERFPHGQLRRFPEVSQVDISGVRELREPPG